MGYEKWNPVSKEETTSTNTESNEITVPKVGTNERKKFGDDVLKKNPDLLFGLKNIFDEKGEGLNGTNGKKRKKEIEKKYEEYNKKELENEQVSLEQEKSRYEQNMQELLSMQEQLQSIKNPNSKEKRELRDIKNSVAMIKQLGTDLDFREKVSSFYLEGLQAKVDGFRIDQSTIRTKTDQNRFLKKGVSTTSSSLHTREGGSLAVDIYHKGYEKGVVDKKILEIAHKYGLMNSDDMGWGFNDKFHFQNMYTGGGLSSRRESNDVKYRKALEKYKKISTKGVNISKKAFIATLKRYGIKAPEDIRYANNTEINKDNLRKSA